MPTYQFPEGSVTMTDAEHATLYVLQHGVNIAGLKSSQVIRDYPSPAGGPSPILRGTYSQLSGSVAKLRSGDPTPVDY